MAHANPQSTDKLNSPSHSKGHQVYDWDVAAPADSVVVESTGVVTLSTSEVCPILYGGTGAASSLTIQSTSGGGTTDKIDFKVGNAGAVTAMSINTTGNLTISNLHTYKLTDILDTPATYQLMFQKKRLTSPYTVQDADYLGAITFLGYDSNSYAEAASIRVLVDGTPGNGDMPGRITFWTSPDGSETQVERMRISNQGIIDFTLQSRARAYLTGASQTFASATSGRVILDAESYDAQGEFDITLTQGTCDAGTTGTTLVATASIFAPGDVGKAVHNKTDDTYTTISAYTNGTTVTLTADIGLAQTETFEFYRSGFKVTKAGYYQVIGQACWLDVADAKRFILMIYVDASEYARTDRYSTGDSYETVCVSDVFYVGAGGYIYLYAFQGDSVDRSLNVGSSFTYLAVHKLS